MSEQVKIDMDSELFREEFAKTVEFTDEVLRKHSLVYSSDEETNERIQQGLTRNQIIYSKRYCPCFFVQSDDTQNRICPCDSALKQEIPQNGICHCQIFCTPEYLLDHSDSNTNSVKVEDNRSSLSAQEANDLLNKRDVCSRELVDLLNTREEGLVDFVLVDVRELMEYSRSHIDKCDHLVPTTSFYKSLDEADLSYDANIVLYCHVGSRSSYCQRIMSDLGYKSVVNLAGGIAAFEGKTRRGAS